MELRIKILRKMCQKIFKNGNRYFLLYQHSYCLILFFLSAFHFLFFFLWGWKIKVQFLLISDWVWFASRSSELKTRNNRCELQPFTINARLREAPHHRRFFSRGNRIFGILYSLFGIRNFYFFYFRNSNGIDPILSSDRFFHFSPCARDITADFFLKINFFQ